jgi:hypothetical protein
MRSVTVLDSLGLSLAALSGMILFLPLLSLLAPLLPQLC